MCGMNRILRDLQHIYHFIKDLGLSQIYGCPVASFLKDKIEQEKKASLPYWILGPYKKVCQAIFVLKVNKWEKNSVEH